MASADLNVAVKTDWALANPWPWLAAGFGLVLWSWIWALMFQATASDYRVIVLAAGLLLTGAGLWLQWADRRRVHLLAIAPVGLVRLARVAMGFFFWLIAFGVTILLILSLIQWESVGWRPGVTSLVWLTVAPLSWCAARRAANFQVGRTPIDPEEESGLAFVAAGLTTGIGSMTLYLGPQLVNDWDTIRLALRVLTAVTLMAGALVIVSIKVRRLVVSLVITLHFCGIATACLSSPPAPPVMTALWTRIFHPYLEFMYLVNAYHFYAPDPGPTSFLWFRIIYEDANGNESGKWFKVPKIDDDGQPNHPVSLEYQRFLALTESLVPALQPPAPTFINQNGVPEMPRVYMRRAQASMGTSGIIVGNAGPSKKQVRIPAHPDIQFMQQYMVPLDTVKRLVASYSRFVAWKYPTSPDTDPGKPPLKFKCVKVYRVVHLIPPPIFLASGRPPDDPQLFRPYYMGTFDADGELTAKGEEDPYLYWLIPIFADNPNDPFAPVKDYVRYHAGDPNWVRHCIVEDAKVKDFVWTNSLSAPVKAGGR